jgi:nucleoside 2-deoxyribosyltransferase
MKIGIIHTINGASEEYLTKVKFHAFTLWREGHEVHCPILDTNQSGTSIEICTSNVEAFRSCDEIHVFYNSASKGTHFDLGACFAMGKKIKVIESEPLTDGKSFQNLLHEWTCLYKS